MQTDTPKSDSEPELPEHNKCYYCKLEHEQVEAGGVWHCPNPLCTGCGAQGWRSKLDSYESCPDSYKVCPRELVVKGLDEAIERGPVVFEAAMDCLNTHWRYKFQNKKRTDHATQG